MPLLLCILSDFLYNLYIYVFGFMIHGRMALSVYIPQVILPEIVYTSVLTLILYPLFLRLDQWFNSMEKRSAKRFV